MSSITSRLVTLTKGLLLSEVCLMVYILGLLPTTTSCIAPVVCEPVVSGIVVLLVKDLAGRNFPRRRWIFVIIMLNSTYLFLCQLGELAACTWSFFRVIDSTCYCDGQLIPNLAGFLTLVMKALMGLNYLVCATWARTQSSPAAAPPEYQLA